MECDSYHEKRGISSEQLWEWEPVRVFVGVWTTADKHEIRNTVRNLYLRQIGSLIDDRVDYKFIIGKPVGENSTAQLLQLAAENDTHGDIVVLNIEENINEGKAYHYWKWVSKNIGMDYDYVSKTDDDTFVHFQNLALNLRPLQRYNLYYGSAHTLAKDNSITFVQGILQVLSVDYVQRIASVPYKRLEWEGAEDIMLGKWLRIHAGSNLNLINEECLIFNDPRIPVRYPKWRKWASPHSIAIHWLKDSRAWKSIIDSYFPDPD